MIEKENSETLNIEDFTLGDLVSIASHRPLIEEISFGEEGEHTYGIVVKDRRNTSKIKSFMPQIAIYVFKSQQVEFHWPSYLTIISSTYKRG